VTAGAVSRSGRASSRWVRSRGVLRFASVPDRKAVDERGPPPGNPRRRSVWIDLLSFGGRRRSARFHDVAAREASPEAR